MVTSSWYNFGICVQQTDTQSKKAFGKELEDLGCKSRKHKADKRPVTRLNNGWRMLSDIGTAENSEKQFNSGLKGSRGNQKSKESYGKKKPKESSTYSLLDDDDNNPIGHETPRSISFLLLQLFLLLVCCFFTGFLSIPPVVSTILLWHAVLVHKRMSCIVIAHLFLS